MSVSIIIKTLNEEKRIAEAVESALRALPGGKVEVIVADSGSKDRTIEIARTYPIKVVQIEPRASQLRSRPATGLSVFNTALYLSDRWRHDNRAGFLPAALDYLDKHPDVGGVTGHVVDQILESLEFQRRAKRHSPEARTGDIDRMNGGGLYRRSAIEQAGYFSDRNLHGHEEFDAGVRLRSNGWKLYRLDRPFVQHFGYTMNAYKLLVRRWKSKYLRGTGEVLRAAIGQPHQKNLFRELPELRLWGAVYLWWLAIIAALVFLPGWPLAILTAAVIAVVPFVAMSVRSRSIELGVYAVVAWIFHAAALPLGFFSRAASLQTGLKARL